MSKSPLLEGVSDAIGFVGGALIGFWIGQLLGWNIFAAGYGTDSIGGILLVGLGGGLGLQLSRRWQARQAQNAKESDGSNCKESGPGKKDR
jgi:F0F1-type ATP synthase assembly protein I